MEKHGFGLDDDPGTGDQKQTNPQESLLLSIQRCVRDLVHACQCTNNCRLPKCLKMKRVVQHAKRCKQKTNTGCKIFKNLIALCCYHAKHCQEAKCPVPFCVHIKNKWRQQRLQQRLQQAQILMRRIAAMQNREMSSAVPSPGNSNFSSQSSPGAQPHSSACPPQSSFAMEHSSRPTVGALQAVQQTQAAAGRQTVPHMAATSYRAANTGLIVPNQQMQAQMQTSISQMSGIPNRRLNMGNVAPWENFEYPQNQQPHQNTQYLPNAQLSLHQPSQIMREPNSMPNSIGDSTMGSSQVMPNPGPSVTGMQRPSQASVQSPASVQQQYQVLAILKANPQLMADFIKQHSNLSSIESVD